MKKLNKKGFTIVELVIVIAVIAILAGVMIPTFSGVIKKAKESNALQEVKNAYTATLADDLADTDTTNDIVYNKDIYVEKDGIYVLIDTNGSAKISDQTGVASAGAEQRQLSSGKLQNS